MVFIKISCSPSKCPFGGDAGPKAKPAESSAADDSDKSDEDAYISEPESDVELDMEGNAEKAM